MTRRTARRWRTGPGNNPESDIKGSPVNAGDPSEEIDERKYLLGW